MSVRPFLVGNEYVFLALADPKAARRLRMLRAIEAGILEPKRCALMQHFQVSAATAKRDLQVLRRIMKDVAIALETMQ